MTRLGEKAAALKLTARFMGIQSTVHPAVLWEGREGATLIDTGYPGQLPAIESALSDLGLKLTDLRRILLTHQDLDHIGCAEVIQAETGAEVFAHAADAPYIQGEKRLLKMDPARVEDRLKSLPGKLRDHARRMLSSFPTAKVTHVLQGREHLPFNGGIDVIPTPGHTPGHVCYYVRSLGLLVAGDALRVENGELEGPSPMATHDLPAAISSLKSLFDFSIKMVLCYHGGLFDRDPAARIKQIAGAGT
jgi:glyoxylase-like metal-dependent hydrolase (beta-lactamase superfamily II)